jgi:hypothetical protein
MFSRWIVTKITSARGTVHCRETRIPCGDQLLICGLYIVARSRSSDVNMLHATISGNCSADLQAHRNSVDATLETTWLASVILEISEKSQHRLQQSPRA